MPLTRTRRTEPPLSSPCSIAIARSRSRGEIHVLPSPRDILFSIYASSACAADCNHGFLSIPFQNKHLNLTVIIIIRPVLMGFWGFGVLGFWGFGPKIQFFGGRE